MSLYIPVVSGNTDSLRSGAESMLSPDGIVVDHRLSELTKQVKDLGYTTTFGAEIEIEFVLDPESESYTPCLGGGNDLYEDLVSDVMGQSPQNCTTWPKGQIIRPADNPGTIMVAPRVNGRYNGTNQGDIVEVRTAPAEAVEATDRYWELVQAIGNVASRNGYLGLILATHINACVYSDQLEDFVDFHRDYLGRYIVASVQHNLLALQPFQIDSGLETGISIQEAFASSKEASTNVYNRRLELRHPTVGLVDPRVDMLAVLDGVERAIVDKIPRQALRNLRLNNTVSPAFFSKLPPAGVKELIEESLWDPRIKKLVLPAGFSNAHLNPNAEEILENFARTFLGDSGEDPFSNNSQFFKDLLEKLTFLYRDKYDIWLKDVDERMSTSSQNLVIRIRGDAVRVVPEIRLDSPDNHLLRRSNISSSSIVRRILGGALSKLSSADDSIEARRNLVESQMIVA